MHNVNIGARMSLWRGEGGPVDLNCFSYVSIGALFIRPVTYKLKIRESLAHNQNAFSNNQFTWLIISVNNVHIRKTSTHMLVSPRSYIVCIECRHWSGKMMKTQTL